MEDSLKPADQITEDEAVTIVDNDIIKHIRPGDTQFDEELERYLNHDDPLEWFTFTHPSQEKLITSEYGPTQLSGVSGSGKTSVLIKRACRLLGENPGKHVLVITLNQSLALLIENVLKALVDEDDFERLQVLPFTIYAEIFLGNLTLLLTKAIGKYQRIWKSTLMRCFASFIDVKPIILMRAA